MQLRSLLKMIRYFWKYIYLNWE